MVICLCSLTFSLNVEWIEICDEVVSASKRILKFKMLSFFGFLRSSSPFLGMAYCRMWKDLVFYATWF